ncbi:LysE family transporter [Eubacteriales bacterium OttesenSCG-928-K08]|nr:LysE family transporter [Eubacteriales bacterium OttesenSCG-928-K08]
MNYASFLLYAVITTFTPGPNNIMAMTTAGRFGFKRASRYCWGVFFGFLALLLLAAVFSSALAKIDPRVQIGMKVVGAGYMLYLAFTILRDKPHVQKEDGKRHLEPDRVFTGIIMQAINPKAIFFSITCMSSYVLVFTSVPLEIGLFALLLSIIALASTMLWAFFGAVFERVFNKHKKVLNVVMALLLAYCAVALFL